MKLVAVLVVLVGATAGAVGYGGLGGAPELRAVHAQADAVRRGDGALLAAFEHKGRAWLRWVRPLTLEPASPPLRVTGDYISDVALSPDSGTLAVGSATHGRIDFVDLRRWRSLGSMRVRGARPAGYRGVYGLVWAGERRLLALAGPPYMRAWPVVVDPVGRRVVHRAALRGTPIRWRPAGKRVVFLSVPERPSALPRAQLFSYDTAGRLRRQRLARIVAGNWRRGRGPWRRVEPGLAATSERAYVLAADGRLAAEVDLRRWRLEYEDVAEARSAWQRLGDLIEPLAHAKGPLESSTRDAHVLPGGAIAVTGEDMESTGEPHDVRTTGYGVRLIDPASWTWRGVDAEAQYMTVAGGVLLARRWSCRGCINALPSIGVRAYDTAGGLRFTRFAGADVRVLGAAGGHAYVGVRRGRLRRIHVIELATGDTVRVLPHRELLLLDPRR
ncbi:MAG: hypothetical protein ACRDLD_12835 [Thermoleophilaceae bacterium]